MVTASAAVGTRGCTFSKGTKTVRNRTTSWTQCVAWALFATLLCATGCDRQSTTPIANGDAVGGAPNVINLEQGWSREIQDQAWFLSFGSRLMPYAWFLHLERADRSELLRADASLSPLGFLPQGPQQTTPTRLAPLASAAMWMPVAPLGWD